MAIEGRRRPRLWSNQQPGEVAVLAEEQGDTVEEEDDDDDEIEECGCIKSADHPAVPTDKVRCHGCLTRYVLPRAQKACNA